MKQDHAYARQLLHQYVNAANLDLIKPSETTEEAEQKLVSAVAWLLAGAYEIIDTMQVDRGTGFTTAGLCDLQAALDCVLSDQIDDVYLVHHAERKPAGS